MNPSFANIRDVLHICGPLTMREVAEFFPGTDYRRVSCFLTAMRLTVVHKQGGQDGTLVYANISGIAPVMEVDGVPVRTPIKPDANYVRVKDRGEGVAPEMDTEDTTDISF